jgi:hypothetical protein
MVAHCRQKHFYSLKGTRGSSKATLTEEMRQLPVNPDFLLKKALSELEQARSE